MAKVRTRSMDGVYPLEKGAVRQGVEGQPIRHRKTRVDAYQNLKGHTT